MRVFHIHGERFIELDAAPAQLPAQGFLWVGFTREEFSSGLADIQAALQRYAGGQLVDLHVSDLLNKQLPSHYDYTSWYDVMVFRRLAPGSGSQGMFLGDESGTAASARQALAAIDTSPVGFALFDRVLVTVHPIDCAVRDYFAQRMAGMVVPNGEGRSDMRGSTRLPTSAADLMLRMLNHIVDSYLELRRLLTRQLGTLQAELLAPGGHFSDWQLLLESRNALHSLEDTCEDQRDAVQEWIDALDELPDEPNPDKRRERELLRVRSRDVLEHIERVLSHVRRLEHSAETAVQMHFSALSHRTNDIMRTLTVLTAIFLPLNLITGFFGMNFDALPLIHDTRGVWAASVIMVIVAIGLLVLFRRKRYLSSRR
ncbi:MAG TPA: magnesium transporter CorA family protein [Rubrivivax sp.]|jgi:Mg2+ and Co2+ transporter CorA|nr:magnesium transporter CorA family protein [Rubrivivax sp.]